MDASPSGALMQEVLQGTEVQVFPVPEGIVFRQIDADTGGEATEETTRASSNVSRNNWSLTISGLIFSCRIGARAHPCLDILLFALDTISLLSAKMITGSGNSRSHAPRLIFANGRA